MKSPMYRLFGSGFALTVLLVASVSHATIGPPVKIKLKSDPAAANKNTRYDQVLEIEFGADIYLDALSIEGSGWTVHSMANVDGTLGLAGDRIEVPFAATPSDPDQPLLVSLELNGRAFTKELDLSPAHVDQMRYGGTTKLADPAKMTPFPGAQKVATPLDAAPSPEVAPKDRAPHLRTIQSPDHDLKQQNKKDRTVTVQGRFFYTRIDGEDIGADFVTVRVYDEDFLWDEELASGTTNTDGYFSFSFSVGNNPDIYVEFELKNGRVEIEDPGLLEESYKWSTGTWSSYSGTLLDIGWHQPFRGADQSGVQIHNIITRAWRWINDNQGRDTPQVDVQWPDGSTGAWFNPIFDEIHISRGHQWREDTCIHEYGHRFMEHFRGNNPGPDYCNAICDTGDCGHCGWCQETDHDALSEGWPNWLANLIARNLGSIYSPAPLNLRDQEDLKTCIDTSGMPCPCDPWRTEGFFGAFLRDIEDSANDDHGVLANASDELSLGPDILFDMVDFENPQTPLDFINKWLARYSGAEEEFWATAANCGYDYDTTQPGAPINMTSTSHNIFVDSPDGTVDLSWIRAQDDASGIAGYGLFIGSAHGQPAPTMDFGDVTTYTTPILTPGVYYFSLRTVDRAGNWDDGYSYFGPVTIREPLPANLNHTVPAGWANQVVPRPTGGAWSGSVPAPTTLAGNTKATYWNVAVHNDGESNTGGTSSVWVMADGQGFFNPIDPVVHAVTINDLAADQIQYVVNAGPLWVSGGRHTFGAVVDFGGQIAETDEFDNEWAKQWIWSPFQMPPDQSLFRVNGTDRDGGWEMASGPLWYNCDGLRFNATGFWNAVYAYAADPTKDYDLRLHDASTGPTNGFGAYHATSARAPDCLDAVLVNTNVVTDPSYDVGVIRGSDENFSGGYNYRHVTSVEMNFGEEIAVSFGTGEALVLREVWVDSANLGPVSISIAGDPADGPFQLLWLDQSFDTGALSSASAWVESDEGGEARLDLNVATQGYYCMAIFQDPKDTPLLKQGRQITLEVRETPPEFVPLQMAGWGAPLVPRPANDGAPGSVPLPTSLIGNAASTYVNFSLENDSPVGVTSDLWIDVLLDDSDLLLLTIPGGVAGAAQLGFNWPTPATVRGGRHVLSLHLDSGEFFTEISELNNVYGDQWVWSPLDVPLGPTLALPTPAHVTAGWENVTSGTSLFWNADALRTPVFAIAGEDGFWASVALMPAAGTNVDLRLHDRSDDVVAGMQAPLVDSVWGPGTGDHVIMNFNVAALTDYDAGVVNFGSGGDYQVDVVSSTFLASNPAGIYGPFALGPDRLVGLHEVFLTAGAIFIQLENLDGIADYGMSMYGPTDGYYGKDDAMDNGLAWLNPPGSGEAFPVDVPQDDFYCIAVWKTGSADVAVDGSYNLNFQFSTDTPPEATPTSTSIANVFPNPFNPRTTISFQLARTSEVSLVIYNLRGERVRTLIRENRSAGAHSIVWNGDDDRGQRVSSGTYFVQMRADGDDDRKKVVLLK